MDIELLAKLGYKISDRCITDTKYSVVWRQVLVGNIVSQPGSYVLRHESYLNFSARFGLLDHKLSMRYIGYLEIQDFPYSETTAGLKLQNQSVPCVLGVEDDFIYSLLVEDLPGLLLDVFKRLKQLWNTARIFDVHLECIDDKIEEGS